jgi:hypothetical protein
MKRYNYRKEYKHLFSPSDQEPEIVQVPPFKYLILEGYGSPEKKKDFQEKMQSVYGLSYTLQMLMRMNKAEPFDFRLAPCSCLWWADDMTAFGFPPRKDEWKWRVMMMQPDRVDTAVVEKAKEEILQKKTPPFIQQVELVTYEEGLCAQLLHIGPYDRVGPTIGRLHQYLYQTGHTFNGYHHEIYLGDIWTNTVSPEKARTIIRQPIKKIR